MSKDLIADGYYGPLRKRGISEETCKFFGYQLCDDFKGKPVHVAPYYNSHGQVVAQKVRFPPKVKELEDGTTKEIKDFTVLGDLKEAGLFGQNLWPNKGKMVVVTEGEIDALSVSQIQDNRWPVVSIPNGASGAKKALAAHLDWLLGFENIILWFDDDEPGRAAIEESVELFPPGRVKIARVPGCKDANEALMGPGKAAMTQAIWNAKPWRPDGILGGDDLWERFEKECGDSAVAFELPWRGLQAKTLGLRQGELWTFCAGSGVGKSAIVRELAFSLLRDGESVGMLMLEESVSRTLKGLIGIELNRPVHLDTTPWADLGDAERAERRAAFDRIGGSTRLHLYDHFGSTESDNLLNRIRYMVTALGCRWIVLDHLSIVVSGIETDDERKTIDVLMTKLRTLVQETGCCILLVSHLKRPEGNKGHEQGIQISLSHLRGSAAIAQLSDGVFGAERDQQAGTEIERNITTIRVLKMRFTGNTGVACHLLYDHATGRLSEVDMESILEEAKKVTAKARFAETSNGDF